MANSFVEFLVDRGTISVEQGTGVVEWARLSRDLLGAIAMEHGLLSGEQICAVVQHQREGGGMFGDACIELGFLNRCEVEVLLRAQEMRTLRCEVERVILGGLVVADDIWGLLGGYYGCEQGLPAASDAA